MKKSSKLFEVSTRLSKSFELEHFELELSMPDSNEYLSGTGQL